MMRLFFRLFLILVFAGSSRDGFSESVRHALLESDSAISFQTQRACYGLHMTKNAMYCTPFPYLLEERGHISFDAYLKANEDAAETLYRLFDKDIDQPLIDKLFKEQDFESSSGLVRVTAAYYSSILSYTPVHYNGAYKISNPSLPDLKISAYQQNNLRFTQNFFFQKYLKYYDIAASGSLFYYKRKYYHGDFDVLSGSGKKQKDLIKETTDSSVDADLAFFLMARKSLVPSFGVLAQNVFNRFDCEDCRARLVDVEYSVFTRVALHTSVFFNHTYGKSIFAAQFPYEGFQFSPGVDVFSVSYVYKLSKLSSFASFSPLMYSFGFTFDAAMYRVGIQYSNEKQDNALEIERRKQTYVYGSLAL